MVQAAISRTDARMKLLNRQVANCMVLFMKLHRYHWYVTGPQFFTLHAKFEELYDEVKGHLDDLAERLLTIGGQPVGDLKGCLETASVREATGSESPEEMVSAIIGDFQTMIAELGQGMEAAEKQGDEATSDLLLGIKSSLEKHIWMLKSFLG
jgi:starvation-inducible DNA-binding protein